jgi:hypothetical protein
MIFTLRKGLYTGFKGVLLLFNYKGYDVGSLGVIYFSLNKYNIIYCLLYMMDIYLDYL